MDVPSKFKPNHVSRCRCHKMEKKHEEMMHSIILNLLQNSLAKHTKTSQKICTWSTTYYSLLYGTCDYNNPLHSYIILYHYKYFPALATQSAESVDHFVLLCCLELMQVIVHHQIVKPVPLWRSLLMVIIHRLFNPSSKTV